MYQNIKNTIQRIIDDPDNKIIKSKISKIKSITSDLIKNILPTTKVGIDLINFYTPDYFLDLKNLAKARRLKETTYQSLGQEQISVIPPDQDIVTMAYNAAKPILSKENIEEIELVLFATESSIDQAKSAGNILHKLLSLKSRCRILELKQTCYSSTAGLQLGIDILKTQFNSKKILLIASDVSRYGLKKSGESSHGSGCIAMILSKDPKLLTIEPEYGIHSEDVMDFWRPNYLDAALLNNKLSCSNYLKSLKLTWREYHKISKRDLLEHQWFCYHVPVPKLIQTAHKMLFNEAKIGNLCSIEDLIKDLEPSLRYSKFIGNCYTASLYLSLVSLIINTEVNLHSSRIGFYSYGSGSVAEFFSGIIQENYQKSLNKTKIKKMISERVELDVKTYEKFYNAYPTKQENIVIDKYSSSEHSILRLCSIKDHKRIYDFIN